MSDKLFLPPGARQRDTKSRDGLYVGAVVVVEHTGYGAEMGDGGELPVNAIVSRVYPDTETAQARDGSDQVWSGVRPFIDAIAVITYEDKTGQHPQVIMIDKIAWAEDVRRINALLPSARPTRPGPQYRVVTSLEGVL